MSKIGDNGGPPIDGRKGDWIAVSREMREHWLVGFGQQVAPADPEKDWCMSRAEAWLDLLMECRFEAGTVSNGGHRMEIKPGQLVGAVSWLASRWNWSPKTVRGWLDKLENDGMIERVQPGSKQGTQKGKQSTIITVCNYSQYQFVEDVEGQAKRQAEGKQGASKGQAEGNIYKDNTGTRKQGNKEELTPTPLPPPLPPQASPASVWGSPREGEEHIGSGVFVNCETIRHRDFSISLLGIEMQLVGTVPMAEIKPVAIGHALQWALDIESGKPASRVVPSNPASFIRGSIQNQRNNSAVTDVRRAKAAAPKEAKSEKLKRLFQAVADEKGGGL